MTHWLVPYLALTTAAVAGPDSWDWQLSQIDMDTRVDLLDTDLGLVTAADVARFQARGTTMVCYVSVGTVEDWRPDADAFPAAVVGKPYTEWPGERFLDIRQLDVLLPLMRDRFQACADLGFDAIEGDVLDMHHQDSGFDVGPDDVVAYGIALAQIAHDLGLQILQKNAPDLAPQLVDHFDMLLTEECAEFQYCAETEPYFQQGKPILNAEYNIPLDKRDEVCALSRRFGILTIFKSLDLDTSGSACP